jgi:hypothetical protein
MILPSRYWSPALLAEWQGPEGHGGRDGDNARADPGLYSRLFVAGKDGLTVQGDGQPPASAAERRPFRRRGGRRRGSRR